MTLEQLRQQLGGAGSAPRVIAVWGAGREGRAALTEFTGRGHLCVLVVDNPDADQHARVLAAEFNVELISPDQVLSRSPSVVIRAPGISKYREEIEQWSQAGIVCTGLTALWLAETEPARVIAVTGTKGKSTTSTLLALILEEAGHRVALGGNIGVPVTEMDRDASVFVVEISSYQAADCVSSPAIGVLTALGEDHVTWHRSVERYHADKLNLFAHEQLRAFVFHADEAAAYPLIGRLVNTGSPQHFSLDGDALVDPTGSAISVASLTQPVRRNLVLAARAAAEFDQAVSLRHVDAALARFTPLPSRQSRVATVDGVEWIDDALASNPVGIKAILSAYADRPLILIMGGDDRGIDLSGLVADLNNSESLVGVVLMGVETSPFVSAVSAIRVPVERVNSDDVAEAVTVASRWATRLDAPNMVISFSPGAPTPATLGTWEQRSQSFREAVEMLSHR